MPLFTRSKRQPHSVIDNGYLIPPLGDKEAGMSAMAALREGKR